jgi:hypothetical protein
MRRLFLHLAWLPLIVGAVALAADDDALRTTTEFGITVTPEDLTDAIEETQQFWEPIRLLVGSKDFEAGDLETRKQAMDLFTQVQEGIYKQLFEGDEAAAQDLVDYLGLRIRKFIIYRDLRKAMSEDLALAQLVERWERAHRDINALPKEEWSKRRQAVLELIGEEMKSLGLSEAQRVATQPIWETLNQCIVRMNDTQTGGMMIGFEHKARQMDRPVGELLRNVINAGDWAMIKKTGKEPLGVEDFKSSWAQLADLRAKRLSVAKPTATPTK